MLIDRPKQRKREQKGKESKERKRKEKKGKQRKEKKGKERERKKGRVELDDEQMRSVDKKNEVTLLKSIMLVSLFFNILIAN